MNKLALALKSRTFWTVVLLCLIKAVPEIEHVNPSQNYVSPDQSRQ
jgi:hypothetical protein